MCLFIAAFFPGRTFMHVQTNITNCLTIYYYAAFAGAMVATCKNTCCIVRIKVYFLNIIYWKKYFILNKNLNKKSDFLFCYLGLFIELGDYRPYKFVLSYLFDLQMLYIQQKIRPFISALLCF